MWLMRHRFDPDLQKWVKKNLGFLVREEREEFESNFEFQENNKNTTHSQVEGRMISGIWFEKLVAGYFAQKYRFFAFPKREERLSNEETKHLLNNPTWDVFWHPVFSYQKYVAEADFLKRNEDGFDLYEVKCVTNIRTKKIKNNLFADFVYQCWVIKNAGYKIKNVYLIYLDKDYFYIDKLETRHLMKISNEFNRPQLKITDISSELNKYAEWLQLPFEEIKKRLLSSDCAETKSVFCTHIVQKIKAKHSWMELYRLRRVIKASLYVDNHNKQLDLKKISLHSYKFTAKQQRQIKVIQKLEPILLNVEKLKETLQNYRFPIYFYDFETSQIAIPKFSQATPYLQIPFQYSIHVVLNKNFNLKTSKNIVHYEFIAKDLTDPRMNFLKNFLHDMQSHGDGTYVAYNIAFEKTILKSLLLRLKVNDFVRKKTNEIIDQTIDLMDFFREFNVYHHNFHGSLSIKSTLPALVPKFNYQNLAIQKGNQASNIYFDYLHEQISQEEWSDLQSDLLKYCGLDTWAMLVMYDKFCKMTQ